MPGYSVTSVVLESRFDRDQDIGSGAWEHKYSSPEHGPIHHVKYFYDKSHIELPDS